MKLKPIDQEQLTELLARPAARTGRISQGQAVVDQFLSGDAIAVEVRVSAADVVKATTALRTSAQRYVHANGLPVWVRQQAGGPLLLIHLGRCDEETRAIHAKRPKAGRPPKLKAA